MEEVLTLKRKIEIMSQTSNYFAKTGLGSNRTRLRNGRAVKLLLELSEEETQVVLNHPDVQKAIMSIESTEILRSIFRKVPAFFQEKMFEDEKVQDLLLTPKPYLTRKSLFKIYREGKIELKENEVRDLENFLHTIKSPKIYDQVVDSKYFQRIVAIGTYKQLKESFFRGMNVEKLFYNIVQDESIYDTRISRKRNIIRTLNNASNHILLPKDYYKALKPKEFMDNKRRKFLDSEVVVDKETLLLMTPPMIRDLLEFKNINIETIKEFLKEDVLDSLKKNNFDFDFIFSHLKQGTHSGQMIYEFNLKGTYVYFNGIDNLYFKVILEECEKDEDLKKRFMNFIFQALFPANQFKPEEVEKLKEILYSRMKSDSIPKEDYKRLFFSADAKKTLFYLKFGKISSRMDYINGITPEQIIKINAKHINQILKALNLENEDELSIFYSYAIKMYFVFGLERTLKILNGDYGRIDRTFFDNVSALKVNQVKMKKEGKKYLPILSDEFIHFMFAKPNENHFIDMINNPKNNLFYKNWSYLYNNFEDIKEKCHGELTLKKLMIILKEISPIRDIGEVTPDNYKLNNNEILSDICLGNKSGKSNEFVYKSVLNIYEQMKGRTESSIPYVKGKCKNGYSYEMMRLNDPIAFTLGYKGNCCIRTNDIAHKHLLHATLCRNGRMLILYNENHEIAAFSPLKRNGEVLIANSIECLHKRKDEKAIEAFEDAVKDIVRTSEMNEKKNQIRLVCIGRNAYAKPKGDPFPLSYPTPTIWEKQDPIYSGTDEYHKTLNVVYKDPFLKYSKIKYGDPKCSYQDPRPPIMTCDFSSSTPKEQEEALTVINAVRYTNTDLFEKYDFRKTRRYGVQYAMYNEDWYILVDYRGEIQSECLNYDARAREEYEKALEKVESVYPKERRNPGYEYRKRY